MINVLGLLLTTIRAATSFALLTVIAAIIIPLYSIANFAKSVLRLVCQQPAMQVGPQDCVVVIGAASAEGYTLVHHTAVVHKCQVIACDGDSGKLHALYDSFPNVRVQLMDPTMAHDTKRLRENVQATGRPLGAVFLVLNTCPVQGEVTTTTVLSSQHTGQHQNTAASSSSGIEGGNNSTAAAKEYTFKQSTPFSLLSLAGPDRGSNRVLLGSIAQCLQYGGKDSPTSGRSSRLGTPSSSSLSSRLVALNQCCGESQLNSTLRPLLEVPLKVAKEVGPALVHSGGKTFDRNWQKGKSRFVVVHPSVLDVELTITEDKETAASAVDNNTGIAEEEQQGMLRRFAQKVVMGDQLVSGVLNGQLAALREIFNGEVEVVQINTQPIRRKLRESGRKDFTAAVAESSVTSNADDVAAVASMSPARGRVTNDTVVRMHESIGAQAAHELLTAVFTTSPKATYYLPSIHDGRSSGAAVGLRSFTATLKQQLKAVGTEEMITVVNWLL